MTNASLSTVAALFASAIGRTVIASAKNGVEAVTYKVARLDEKTGTLKSGEKLPYVILTRSDNTATVVRLHPEAAKRLFKLGVDSGFSVVYGEGEGGEIGAQEQTALQAELVEEQKPAVVEAKPEVAAAVEKEAKAPSKKDLTIAMYTTMTAAGLPRKDIIAKMKSELGLSVPGANTYYQNCKSGAWKA